jgi:tetratricopeptide (TPR) repeat protein
VTLAAAPAAIAVDFPPPVLPGHEIEPPRVEPGALEADRVQKADRQAADRLMTRINAKAVLDASDIRAAEDLHSRYPDEPPARRLLEATLITVAMQHRARHDFAQATASLKRASVLFPDDPEPWIALLQVSMEANDWPEAESAARGALALDATRAEALYGLGYALFRQDRSAEAVEVLERSLQLRPDLPAQALLDRIRKVLADEKGMKEQQLSHFHVRYDGEAHDDVGREILRALERHYATLATTLDHQPATAIPVILFSRQGFYDASGAPAWSGGAFDGLDGRIRIPIGGLTASLSPEMDNTLLHELTHAFVADRTRGAAPREIHEGLAQYMEGERLVSKLDADGLAALAGGRIGGVPGFYLGALSFVEYLVAQRGMGGMNELLKALGETGSVETGFQQVYGRSYRAIQQEHWARLRREYGR